MIDEAKKIRVVRGKGLEEYYDFYGYGRNVEDFLLVVEGEKLYTILGNSSPSKLKALCYEGESPFPNADNVIGLEDRWYAISENPFLSKHFR
ncbi:hypothetical protein KAT80_00670 [Candidatus Pacearchaeota archaeon]|nr:hypothetical protein [Candidatus Pacearchaeota archaeon]